MNGPATGGPSYCPDCGTELGRNASFCPGCGSAVGGIRGATYCSGCGTAFDPEDQFCSNCGLARESGGDHHHHAGGRHPDQGQTPGPSGRGASGGQGGARRGGPRGRRGPPGGGPRGGQQGGGGPTPGGPAQGNTGTPGPGASGRGPDRSVDPDERERFNRRIQSYLADGWSVEADYGDSVVLVDRGMGNLGIHVLLFLFTSGIGNLVYWWYNHEHNAERIRLNLGEPAPSRPTPSGDGSEGPDVVRWTAGTFLLLIGLVMISTLSPIALVFGLSFVTAGTLTFPPTEERLGNRKPVTTFGSTRSTDETIVHDPSTPCVVCNAPIGRGVERSYSEEFVLAGIPLFTTESGENYYCEECAADPTTDPDSWNDVEYGTGDVIAEDDDLDAVGSDDPTADESADSDPSPAGTDRENVEYDRN